MQKRERRERGMTLLEVLIAIAIMAFGISGMMMMQVLAMRDEAIARSNSDASQIAQDTLETIARLSFDEVGVTGDAYEDADIIDLAGYDEGEVPVQMTDVNGDTIDQRIYQVQWKVRAVAGQSSLRTVDVQISWIDDAEMPQTYTVSTLKYDPDA